MNNANLDEIQDALSIENTRYKFIGSLDDLIWLCDYLGKNNRSKIREIGVDLEHHSYRSYLGFTCLMQISTRYDDFVIDTLKLRSEMYRLNEVFTDWTLTKILHGSDFDIEWLQKDFGIYVVNMFDTGQAARVLQYPHYSLSYLLQRFCGVNAQKQYQLADWRQRPLSEEMLKYAREDTHYLMFIYDNLKKELVKTSTEFDNRLKQVFDKSSLICKKTFKKPVSYSKGFLTLCQNNSHLNSRQLKALNDLYRWRDNAAREVDESGEYVLKSFQLLKIAELLPREIYGILALCNPLSHVVQANVHEMCEVIKNAREFKGVFTLADINGIQGNDQSNSILNSSLNTESKAATNILDSIVQSIISYDPNSLLNCAHDFPHQFDHSNDENQNIMQDTTENVSKSNLSDLFISKKQKKKEENVAKFDLPESLLYFETVNVKNVFTFKSQKIDSKNRKLLEKINEIKKSIQNPFEMYLPSDLRRGRPSPSSSVQDSQWSLIKPRTDEENKQLKSDSVKIEPVKLDKEIEDLGMIPIKIQIRAEKKVDQEKKLKKAIKKNVDFTDAIIKFNKQKSVINALGASQQDEGEMNYEQPEVEFDELSQKIHENLKSLSETVNKSNIRSKMNIKPSTSTNGEPTEFNYDPNRMNQMFAGSSKNNNNFDPTSKIKRTNFGKVSKRRQTNALTRSNNNQSFIFKK